MLKNFIANISVRLIILVLFALSISSGCVNRKKNDLIKVLILSGKNNHEWKKTTPVLVRMYKKSGLFAVKVSEKPDTLTYNKLKKFDVVVSNWNEWPDTNIRMTKSWETDFLRYVKKGGGAVFIHAGASSFYSWKEYHQMGIGRWGKETRHGKLTKAKIYGFDTTHPITQGLRDFYTFDEIWEKTDIYPGVTALASVSVTNEKDSVVINEPAMFVNHTGNGLSFYTILGHDERAFINSGLQTILLRATQWVSHHEVTIKTPLDLKETSTSKSNNFSWEQSDTSLCLTADSEKIWQFNFNNRLGKPYFHPVAINNSTLTCVSPADHPWHLGLWFSWKFINGVNYWEYLNDFKSDETGYKSAGITKIQNINITKNSDYSADIRMDLQYHPEGGDAVMAEKRNIHVSPPGSDGSYFIDHDNSFSPLIDEVILDRTPVEGEPGGQSWGGYAGLSVRFNQDYMSPAVIAPSENNNYKKDKWLYMGFNTLTGDSAGICIIQNTKYTTSSTSWYVISQPEIPFFYFSPAVLFDGKIVLKKGENLQLKYRVWILPGKTGRDELQSKYDEYMNN